MSRIDLPEGGSTPVRQGMLLLMGAVVLTTAGCITTGAKTSDATTAPRGRGQDRPRHHGER